MKENIVIFSHNTHTFLKNEIIFASNNFQRVVVIYPHNNSFESSLLNLHNVELLPYTKKELFKSAVFALPKIFRKEMRKELRDSLSHKTFTLKYLKIFIYFLALSRLFGKYVNKKLNISIEESNDWVFYSAWYYGTAFAITEAKRKYKFAKTVSLAHSFEIDKVKNRYTTVLFRKQYHKKLDLLSFISGNVFDEYKETVAKNLCLSLNNTEVRYLGANKLIEGMSTSSSDGIFRIVSCSNIIPVKRIELIFYALDSIYGINIEWTHFGNGVLMNSIAGLVSNKKNGQLSVNLMGSIENSRIHEFYVNNTIDLFINVSASEGIPVSIMEAIAYGIPVIATDVGGNSEIVKDSFGKLISDNPTCDEIKEVVLSMLNLSETDKILMRERASEYFQSNFNAEKLRTSFFKILKG